MSGSEEPRSCVIKLYLCSLIIHCARHRFHDEEEGSSISNACESGLPPKAAFAQMYKIWKCGQMIKEHEAREGMTFDWVVRARPDIAWLRKVKSVAEFDSNNIYVAQNNFWPVNDQFALVPREHMGSYFDVVFSYFECGDRAWFPDGVGAPDCMLWRYLVHNSTVPVLMYDFDMVIVRLEDGPRCSSLSKSFNLACQVVMAFGEMGDEGEKRKATGLESVFLSHSERLTSLESDDPHLCTDSFNAKLQRGCFEDLALVGWGGAVSKEVRGCISLSNETGVTSFLIPSI